MQRGGRFSAELTPREVRYLFLASDAAQTRPEAASYLSLYQATWSVAFAVNPAITLPLHAALGERRFWGLAPLVALPGVIALLRLDRSADRPPPLAPRE